MQRNNENHVVFPSHSYFPFRSSVYPLTFWKASLLPITVWNSPFDGFQKVASKRSLISREVTVILMSVSDFRVTTSPSLISPIFSRISKFKCKDTEFMGDVFENHRIFAMSCGTKFWNIRGKCLILVEIAKLRQ